MENSEKAQDYWRKCTTCKNLIGFNAKYWICSVSTCTRQRTGLVFCNVACFDAHVPVLNHRDAGAIEQRAPSKNDFLTQQQQPVVSSTATTSVTRPPSIQQPVKSTVGVGLSNDEILVVVSKVKAYILERSSMNTSASVMNVLSRKIRQMADAGISSAERNGRKTVLDRDIS